MRKEKIVLFSFLILVIIVLSYTYFTPKKNVNTIEFETIAKGQYSGISERTTIVVDTKEEWELFLNRFISNNNNSEIEKYIFEEGKYTIITVTMHENQTTGYDIEIRKIYDYPDYIKLDIIQELPCAGCPLEETITRPYHIVAIPKTDKEVRR